MLHDIVTKGSVDRSVTLRIIDSTDGTPETGVVFNTSGIDLWYRREGAAVTSITEATLAALTTAHTDGGFLTIGHGYYRLDLPDAAFATGANYVDFGGTVTGMVVIGGRVRLVDYSLEDSVRMGLTSLPNAAAAASGGLFTRGTGAGQINQDANGRIDVNTIAFNGTAATASAGRPEVNTTHAAGTAWGSGAITAASIGTDAITAAKIATDAITEIQSGLATAAALATVDGIVDDILVDTAVIGVAGAGLTALATQASVDVIDGIVDSILVDTAEIGAAGAGLTTLATAANLATVAGYLDTEIAAILADTNELQTDWANGGRLDLILDARASQTSVDTVDGIVDSILVDTAEIGAAGAGLTVLATAAALATVDTVVDAILVDTAEIGAAGAGLTALASAAAATAIEADTQNIQSRIPAALVGGRIDANIGAVNNVTVDGAGTALDPFGPV